VNAEASALLEKGVNSEETKGDLDAAMQFYRQVIAETEAGQALAAQAQFRLATCYEKKNDHAAATAAFAKLVHDYPNQKELVTLASKHLVSEGPELLPVPWIDGEEMRFRLNLPSGIKLGVARFGVKRGEVDGRQVWQFNSQLFAGVQQWSRAEVDFHTFKPIHCRWKHSLVGEAETTYSTGGANVKLNGASAVKHMDLDGVVYDNEQTLQLMRRLPLADGFTVSLKIFAGLTGGTLLPLQLTVEAHESVTVPAGTFDCYKVGLNIGQTYWFSTDAHHYLVKLEGGGFIGELAAVKQQSAIQAERFDDPARKFSVAVPAGWIIDQKEGRYDASQTELVLLDTEAIGTTYVKVLNANELEPAARVSVRGLADRQIAEGSKHYKEFAVRANSWTETTIAGQPAVSVVVDLVVQGKIRQTVCGVYAFVDGNAVDISSTTTPEDFETYRPQFNDLVASYRGQSTK
jgi:hypothetical protein